MERTGMWAALAGTVVLVVFSIWRVLSVDDLPIVARVGGVLVVGGVLAMLLAIGRQRMRDKKTEDLDEVEP